MSPCAYTKTRTNIDKQIEEFIGSTTLRVVLLCSGLKVDSNLLSCVVTSGGTVENDMYFFFFIKLRAITLLIFLFFAHIDILYYTKIE